MVRRDPSWPSVHRPELGEAVDIIIDATGVPETRAGWARGRGSTLLGAAQVREDGLLDVGAYLGPGGDVLRAMFPRPVGRDSGTGTAILDRRVIDYPDTEADDVPAARALPAADRRPPGPRRPRARHRPRRRARPPLGA